jgi:hypothetical protein
MMKQVYTIKEAIEPVDAGGFFLTLLHSATNTHIHHLQTSSYSQHVALGEFYDSIVELTDGLIEAYQGTKGIVSYPNVYTPPLSDGLSELKALNAYIIAYRLAIGVESNLQNEVDTILSLIQSTMYKLNQLK